MGAICSKSSNGGKAHSKSNGRHYYQSDTRSNLGPPSARESMEKRLQEPNRLEEPLLFDRTKMGATEYGTNPDDFYDGIPRFTQKSRSGRSTQAAVAKVSEVSSRLGRAGTLGLGKAVEVLDNLGSSMTNLNASSGFISGVANKGNDVAILSFEIANTIVKGSTLMQSLSKRSIRNLKEVVLPSEGVQHLVSKDTDELLRIVAADKSEELKIFSGEVVRFGNQSKDPQWHNLDRYFEKISKELTPQRQLKEEAESVMQQLMTLVQYTAELYHELNALDRFEQDCMRKRLEDDRLAFAQKSFAQKGDGLAFLRGELKSQRKLVRNLKKKSLWSRTLEEVMEKLVHIVHFLILELHNAFGSADNNKSLEEDVSNHQKLGPAGLSLHYANIIIQIDTLVARSSSMPPNTRDALYQNLPPSIKSALRSKLQSFHVKEEITIAEIKAEMEKTLQWLAPMATNTAKAHHGFGWVGEWASTGSEMNRKPTGQTDVIQVETLHHADKDKMEAYILDLILWLNHLVRQSKTVPNDANDGGDKSTIKSPILTPIQKTENQPNDDTVNASSSVLGTEDEEMLQVASMKKGSRGVSKSLDFDSLNTTKLRKHDRLSKSSSHSPTKGSKEPLAIKKLSSGMPVIDFSIDKEKALDVIDRVDMLR